MSSTLQWNIAKIARVALQRRAWMCWCYVDEIYELKAAKDEIERRLAEKDEEFERLR